MIGLILCAGNGTRLKEETKYRPKCMVEVGGKPVLERIADYLNKQGVDRIVVNLHSFPEIVIKHFGQRFIYLYEPVPMGEFSTVSLIKAWFPNEDILLANGDTLIEEKIDLGVYPPGFIHNGLKLFTKNEVKLFNTDFVDIGTPSGLAKARKKYDRN